MKFVSSRADSILYYCFILLVFITPIIFYSRTYELFEFNKMMFVYLLTIVIATFWVVKMIGEKRCIWEKTPLDIPIALFLLANLISTILSIDTHISIFGYYSRLNGGLLSIISYAILYYGFMATFPRERIKYLLGAIVFGGLIVSLWAIPEHFGIDPSCKILVDSWKADCWIQDVQARVFATLGQPNWLAAYLAMIIPVSLGLMLLEKNFLLKLFYLLSSLAMTLAFIFTFSRGGMLGLAAGVTIFISLIFLGKRKLGVPKLGSGWSFLGVFIAFSVGAALYFGTAFNKPLQITSSKAEPAVVSSEEKPQTTTTQLESGGTETGQIRLIVWKGALAIWKAYPIFGSGVETFAYSYYRYRPVEHNQTTEWDFLYNKAHNEYLNYLATTGAFGLATYLLLIATFLLYTLYKLITGSPYHRLVISGLFGAQVTYLVQNFFSFSVVIIALFFFLYPAITFKLLNQTQGNYWWTLKLVGIKRSLISTVSKLVPERANYQIFLFLATMLASGALLFGLYRLYTADLKFNDGLSNQGDTSWETSKYLLEQALILNPLEPFYMSELGYVNSVLAQTATTDTEAEARVSEAEYWTTQATTISPQSLSYWKSSLRVYTELMGLYEGYEDKALVAAQKTVELAPTEPKVRLNLATLYQQLGRNTEAAEQFQKVTQLKPDYREAYLGLARSLDAGGKRPEAIKVYQDIRVKFPQETEAQVKLQEWTGSKD